MYKKKITCEVRKKEREREREREKEKERERERPLQEKENKEKKGYIKTKKGTRKRGETSEEWP